MKKILIFALMLILAFWTVACMGGDDTQTSESLSEEVSVSSEESSGASDPVTRFTVTFDTDGGSYVEALSVSEGGKIQKPEDPKKSSREGEYEFVCWLYQGAEWDFENDVVTGDITLVASWNIVVEYPPAVEPED